MFCSEPVYTSTFDTVEQFEKHVAEKQLVLVKLSQSWITWNILLLQNEIITFSLQCQYDSFMFSNSRKTELSFI